MPLVRSVLSGFNATLFAYGQTGSGKTYTIGEIAKLGTEHEGVAHRVVRALYAPPPAELPAWRALSLLITAPSSLPRRAGTLRLPPS